MTRRPWDDPSDAPTHHPGDDAEMVAADCDYCEMGGHTFRSCPRRDDADTFFAQGWENDLGLRT